MWPLQVEKGELPRLYPPFDAAAPENAETNATAALTAWLKALNSRPTRRSPRRRRAQLLVGRTSSSSSDSFVLPDVTRARGGRGRARFTRHAREAGEVAMRSTSARHTPLLTPHARVRGLVLARFRRRTTRRSSRGSGRATSASSARCRASCSASRCSTSRWCQSPGDSATWGRTVTPPLSCERRPILKLGTGTPPPAL